MGLQEIRQTFKGVQNKLQKAGHTAKDALFGKTEDTASGVQQLEMADARKGIIYFLGNIGIERKKPELEFGLVESFVADPEFLEDAGAVTMGLLNKVSAIRNTITKAKGKVQPVKDWTADKINHLKEIINGYFDRLLRWLEKRFGGAAAEVAEGVPHMLTMVSAFLREHFAPKLTEAIPGWDYVDSAADLYKAAKNGTVGAWHGVQQLYSGWGVNLLGGHPSLISNALARHSLAVVGGALKDIAVTSGKVALAGAADAAAGVGKLVFLILNILKRVAGALDNYFQHKLLKRCFSEAKKEWQLKDGSSLINSHEKFSAWFQKKLIATPVVAALVVNSGFAANPIRFLQLLSKNGDVATQEQFNKGVTYIETLKRLGGKYVREYVESYSTSFRSNDKLVAAKLNESLTGKGVLGKMSWS